MHWRHVWLLAVVLTALIGCLAMSLYAMSAEPALQPIAQAPPVAESRCFAALVGASWCPPCQQMHPHIDALYAEGWRVYHVDVDTEAEQARGLGVTDADPIPVTAIYCYRDRKIVPLFRSVGYVGKEALELLFRKWRVERIEVKVRR